MITLDHPAPETIPISALNTLAYCPRRFFYTFVQCEMLVNEFVLEGSLAHQHVHEAGTQTSEGTIQTTRMYLYSETLRLSGFADIVEEQDGMVIPVEYKRGRQGHWLNDEIQLCAQALCLEEQRPEAAPILYGYIFYIASRQRVQVPFTGELRASTREAIIQAFQVASQETIPLPLKGKLTARCPNCSLQPLCLPDEVNLLRFRP
jgi:CRISPR-associated exonuclease Cas4